MTNKRVSAYLYILLTAIIWGAAGPIIKFTLADFPPLIFLTYRFALSSIIGLIYFAKNKEKTTKNSNLLLLILLCAFVTSTLRLGSLFFGFDETSSISATLISSMTPVFMALTGYFLLKEHISKSELFGMGIAMIGTLISILTPILAETDFINASLYGNLIVLGSVLIDVFSVLLVKIIMNKKAISPSRLTHTIFIVGFITLLPVAIFVHSYSTIISTILSASWQGHLGVLYMAFISGTLAYTLQSKGLKVIEMGDVSIFAYLMPIFAAPLSIFWLHEKITLPFVFGSFIIAIGVFIAEYHHRRR